MLEPLYMRSVSYCTIRGSRLFIALFLLIPVIFKNYVFSMKQLLKIVLILFDSPSSQRTDKNLFLRVAV